MPVPREETWPGEEEAQLLGPMLREYTFTEEQLGVDTRASFPGMQGLLPLMSRDLRLPIHLRGGSLRRDAEKRDELEKFALAAAEQEGEVEVIFVARVARGPGPAVAVERGRRRHNRC